MAVTERPLMPSGTQQSLSDVVYDKIRSRIADGTWPARSRLPSEAELVELFAISRPVVRQALARLRENGLISSRQGSGSFVQNLERVQPVVHFPAIGSVADLDRFLTFREGIEGEAAAAAATSHSERRVSELKARWAVSAITCEDDFEFHMAVAVASENPFYVNTLASLREQILFGMHLARSFSAGKAQALGTISENHWAIVEAIVARDATEARLRMREHLQQSRAQILTGR